MPIRVRWKSKEYIGIGLLLFGMCGMFQLFFILVGQYFLGIGNYFVVIFIPIGATLAMFLASIIIFESYAQVERREKLRSQFRKTKIDLSMVKQILEFPITKPLLIVFIVFLTIFFITFYISMIFLDELLSFLIAENVSAIISLLIANLIEKNFGRIQRY
ncbi:MAG: hypothetical protein ACW986_12150 [Promethearchaeota archaeon]|jgi:hypothetical protein